MGYWGGGGGGNIGLVDCFWYIILFSIYIYIYINTEVGR